MGSLAMGFLRCVTGLDWASLRVSPLCTKPQPSAWRTGGLHGASLIPSITLCEKHVGSWGRSGSDETFVPEPFGGSSNSLRIPHM